MNKVYKLCKLLIAAGKMAPERLAVYLEAGAITEAEYRELAALLEQEEVG